MKQLEKNITTQSIQRILGEVYDPEIPVLSIIDLGVLRKIEFAGDKILVHITPTYSGCPAMDVIAWEIGMALVKHGFSNYEIIKQLSPAWTTDWITEKGRQDLEAYGIAPPVGKSFDSDYLKNLSVTCPLCKSDNTKLLSEFGSTACKALYQCHECQEPFDYFKCH